MVDDEAPVCRALSRLLQSNGFHVETFPSGASFLDSIEHHAPSCVVLDHHMPEMTGLEVQARLNAMPSSIPVIFITGHDVPELRQRAIDSGASAYLCKPVDQDELFDAVRHAIAGD